MTNAQQSVQTKDSYRPVGAEGETQSGAVLLFEAYAAFWLFVFIFIFIVYRRLRKVEGRLASLVTALAQARGADKRAAPEQETPKTN